jgi:formiminoglutamase
MSLTDFLTPIDLTKISPAKGYYTSHLGDRIQHSPADLSNIGEDTDIAIIGVQDDRNAVNNSGCALGPDYIREKLYLLNEGNYATKITDLGNILTLRSKR